MNPLDRLREAFTADAVSYAQISKQFGPNYVAELRNMYFPNWVPLVSIGNDLKLDAGFQAVPARDAFEGAVIRAVAPAGINLRISVQG
jgi:hypothetical protein